MRLQRLLHVDVDAVAAGGYQHALAGVDLDVSVLAFADGDVYKRQGVNSRLQQESGYTMDLQEYLLDMNH